MNKAQLIRCKKIFITTSFLTLIFSGCATHKKSTALGGIIGAGTGVALGGIIDPGSNGKYRTRNIIIGSAVGGIAGSLAGSSIFKGNEKRKHDEYEKGKKNAEDAIAKQGNMPDLKEPKIEARWIEGRVVGNRYIDGHFEYIITEPTRWELK